MPLLACSRSKSTGDPWLTDGSYFDGTGYAEIKFESQFGTTKRFEQEIRLVSYNGILFFLENQAGARSSREPPPLCQWAGAVGRRGLWRWQSAAWSSISALLLKATRGLDTDLTAKAVTCLVPEGLP